ncbi:MAG: lon, partial [Rhodocyclales bacterium]|nr:lon [Rhodocyclales bacterium]
MNQPSQETTWSLDAARAADAAVQAAAATSGGALKRLPEDTMILIPLRDAVLFPGNLSPVTVGRATSVMAAQEAVKNDLPVGFLLQRDATQDKVGPNDLYWVGTSGPIVRYITGKDGGHHLVVQGQSRFQVREFVEGWPFMVGRVQMIEEAKDDSAEVEARFVQLKEQALEAVALLPHLSSEVADVIRSIDSPAALADMVANLIDEKVEEKQDLLETFDLVRRLDKVIALLASRVGVLKLTQQLREKTQATFDERQREHILREQLRQIQKELGEDDNT